MIWTKQTKNKELRKTYVNTIRRPEIKKVQGEYEWSVYYNNKLNIWIVMYTTISQIFGKDEQVSELIKVKVNV